MDTRIYMTPDSTLEDALEDAYGNLKVEDFVPIQRCRLVAYDHAKEKIIRSFEGLEKETFDKITYNINPLEFLIEMRDENSEFEIIQPGGVMTKVFTVDIFSGDVDGPTVVRGMAEGTVGDYKKIIAKKLNLQVDEIILALHKFAGIATILDCDNNSLSIEDVSCLWYS